MKSEAKTSFSHISKNYTIILLDKLGSEKVLTFLPIHIMFLFICE